MDMFAVNELRESRSHWPLDGVHATSSVQFCTFSGVVLQPAGQVAAPGEDEDDRLLRPDILQIESAGLKRKVARSPLDNFRADAEDGLSHEENESRNLEIWQIHSQFCYYDFTQF